MSQMNNFAETVVRKRKEKNMTQEALAKQLGISPQAVSKWENGLGLPDVTLFPALAEALDVSLSELFGIEMAKAETPIVSIEEIGHLDEKHKKKDKFALVEREWSNFPKSVNSLHFSIHSSCKLRILRSEIDSCKLYIKSTKFFMDATAVECDQNTLTVRVRPPEWKNWKPRTNDKNEITLWVPFEKGKKVRISMYGACAAEVTPDFEEGEMKISGSGEFVVQSFENRLEARISGSGSIKGQESLGTTKLRISGSGDMFFTRAADADMKISGSGNIHFGYLQGQSMAQISGSGKIKVAEASGKLSAKVSGSGGFTIERMTENAAKT